MGLKLFNAPALPKPPDGYEPGYFKQLTRILGLYFSQLDSLTPNHAESYTADSFFNLDYSTVANLPAAADYKGARTFITDSDPSHGFGTVVTGGGSQFLPVYSDGTDWRYG